MTRTTKLTILYTAAYFSFLFLMVFFPNTTLGAIGFMFNSIMMGNLVAKAVAGDEKLRRENDNLRYAIGYCSGTCGKALEALEK